MSILRLNYARMSRSASTSQRTLVADYNARIFLIETVLRFLTHVNRMVVALHEASNPTLFDPRMLDASEVDDLLRLASGGAPAFNGTVQELLSSALARSSQNPVAEFGSQSWSLEGTGGARRRHRFRAGRAGSLQGRADWSRTSSRRGPDRHPHRHHPLIRGDRSSRHHTSCAATSGNPNCR